MPVLSRNVDQKSLETEFLIAICRRQSKTLFLSIFDPRSLIVDSVFDCLLLGVLMNHHIKGKNDMQLRNDHSQDSEQTTIKLDERNHQLRNSSNDTAQFIFSWFLF